MMYQAFQTVLSSIESAEYCQHPKVADDIVEYEEALYLGTK